MNNDPAYKLGYVTGQFLVIAFLIGSIALCGSSLRRRRANFKCIVSLMLVLGGFLLVGVTFVFKPSAPAPMFMLALGFGVIISMIAGAVLAIIGLAEYRHRR